MLKNAVQLTHLENNYTNSVFSDQLDKLLARVVTQAKEAEK